VCVCVFTFAYLHLRGRLSFFLLLPFKKNAAGAQLASHTPK